MQYSFGYLGDGFLQKWYGQLPKESKILRLAGGQKLKTFCGTCISNNSSFATYPLSPIQGYLKYFSTLKFVRYVQFLTFYIYLGKGSKIQGVGFQGSNHTKQRTFSSWQQV